MPTIHADNADLLNPTPTKTTLGVPVESIPPLTTHLAQTLATGIKNELAHAHVTSSVTVIMTMTVTSMPPTSTSFGSRSHILPIIITTPAVFSIGLIALVLYYCRRRNEPETDIHGVDSRTDRSSRRYQVIEPFDISRNEALRELSPGSTSPGKSMRLGFETRHQAMGGGGGDILNAQGRQVSTEETINLGRNAETADPNSGSRTRPSLLADQVEVMQERLRVMVEGTIYFERNLQGHTSPPQYTPTPDGRY